MALWAHTPSSTLPAGGGPGGRRETPKKRIGGPGGLKGPPPDQTSKGTLVGHREWTQKKWEKGNQRKTSGKEKDRMLVLFVGFAGKKSTPHAPWTLPKAQCSETRKRKKRSRARLGERLGSSVSVSRKENPRKNPKQNQKKKKVRNQGKKQNQRRKTDLSHFTEKGKNCSKNHFSLKGNP